MLNFVLPSRFALGHRCRPTARKLYSQGFLWDCDTR